jgi:peptidoglycan-binding protein ArfA
VHTVSRRYRQNLGGWWWGAFVGVPLVLATIGSGSFTSAAVGVAPTNGSTLPGLPAPASPTSVSLQRTGQSLTISGSFPDATAKQAALSALQASFGNAASINDLSYLAAGSCGLSTQAATALGPALAAVPELSITFDGTTALLIGTAPTDQARQATLAAIAAAFPGARVNDQLRVGPATTAADCSTIATQLGAVAGDAQIRFSYGASDLTKTSQRAIRSAAKLLKACPRTQVTVLGYADNSGSTKANLAISADRAEAVADQLRSQGVTNRIAWQARGSANPITTQTTEDARTNNRRATIVANQ